MEPNQEQKASAAETPAGSIHSTATSTTHSSTSTAKEGASKNLIIGLILAVLVGVLGLMYLWGSQLDPQSTIEEIRTTLPPVEDDAQIQALQQVSTSDEVVSIETDLEATELSELDAELDTMDTELEAALVQ